MKAQDLMIGDWVRPLNVNSPFQIVEIGPDYICNYSDTAIWVLDEIEPIPITAEILEKNGFIYNDIPFVLAWEQFGLSIYGTHGNYRINCGQNVGMDVSYVHQLQHALRLCQIEKEIQL